MARARYKQLVDAFAADIRAGVLAPGTRLPTHRQLAAQEGLALVTASRVYAELEAMGLVSGEAGRGTYVRETALPPGQGVDQPATTAGTLDLNFNYPALPGRPSCCAVPCANWPWPAIWRPCCATSLTPGAPMNGRRWPVTSPAAG